MNNKKTHRIASLAIVLFMILGSTVPTQAATPAVEATATGASIYWGAMIGKVPSSANMQPGGPYNLYETRSKKKMAIIHWGQPWMMKDGTWGEFQTSYFNNVRKHGSIPMINWNSWRLGYGVNQPNFQLRDVYGGKYDTYIKRWATAAKNWGHPFFLRFDHEMNGWWFPWGEGKLTTGAIVNGNSPGDYVKAWGHVHDIFTSVGATNVTWVWAPNHISTSKRYPGLSTLYPGDAYVDWTGFSVYNKYPTWLGLNSLLTGSGTTWLKNSYRIMLKVAPTKPMMLAETASIEAGDGGAKKAAWIKNTLTTQLPINFPKIKAIVYFNWNVNGQSYPVESSQAAIDAWAAGISLAKYATNQFAHLNTSPIPPISALRYTIRGNTGVAGVALTYTNGTLKSVLSDSSGNYSITVPFGWSGTVTPSKTGYIFSPVNRTYSKLTANRVAQNYIATALYSLSGNTGVADTTLSYMNGTPKTVISRTNGNYSFTAPSGWSGTVTPTHVCFTFSPASHNYSNLASSQTSQDFTPILQPGCAHVSVLVSGATQGRFGLPPLGSTAAGFPRLNQGPLEIVSPNAIPLIATQRVLYKMNKLVTSYSELLGLPNAQLDTIYWLPWYNNTDLDTQLRFANVSGLQATVHVYMHGIEVSTGCSPSNSPFTLAAGTSLRLSCTGISTGPVKIEADQNIVAAARVIYKVDDLNTSYSEMMALPNRQVTNTYWLPWYNHVDLDTRLSLANLSTQQAMVHVYIANQEMNGSPFTLQMGESTQVSFASVNAGPVKIEADQNIVASERVIYNVDGVDTSFSEMMALPNSQVNTIYWLPWYNNVGQDTQLRLANLNPTQQASVHVWIAGQEVNGSPFTLQAGESAQVSLAGINNGPVKIESDQDLVATARLIYKVNGTGASFSEMMALPNSQLDSIYWWPWYNNRDLNTQLRFGRS